MGYDSHGKCIVMVDLPYFRSAKVETLLGNPRKGKRKTELDAEITLDELVAKMITYDLKCTE